MAHDELQGFMGLMHELRERGNTLVFVSHRIREILSACDRVYILKDGAIVCDRTPDTLSELDMHALMVGRARTDEYYHESQQQDTPGKVVLKLTKATSGDAFHDVDLAVRAGEIVGIGGVTGSGKEALGRAIAGLVPLTDGQLVLEGRDVSRDNLRTRVRRGIGYVPLDRHEEGVVLSQSVLWNTTLSSLDGLTPGLKGFISVRKERRRVKQLIEQLRIVPPDADLPVVRLSGGNQQKVVIGRVVLTRAHAIVLDNPTRGVDAGAKYEIYGVIRKLAADGVAIILVTEDLPELIGLSNRIVVMRDGAVQSVELAAVSEKPSEEQVVAGMV